MHISEALQYEDGWRRSDQDRRRRSKNEEVKSEGRDANRGEAGEEGRRQIKRELQERT